ncbi:hypothetical protein NPIL_300271, partial [Nephila pilipes]
MKNCVETYVILFMTCALDCILIVFGNSSVVVRILVSVGKHLYLASVVSSSRQHFVGVTLAAIFLKRYSKDIVSRIED